MCAFDGNFTDFCLMLKLIKDKKKVGYQEKSGTRALFNLRKFSEVKLEDDVENGVEHLSMVVANAN